MSSSISRSIPPMVIIELDEGYVVAASNECVTLTSDAAKAMTFACEGAALNYVTENAPGVLAWAGCIKFCRCTSSSFLRALGRQRSPASARVL